MAEETKARIENELEVKAYIQDLKFSLNNGAQIDFQAKREYSCAVTPQIRQTGNRLSGNAGTAYASLLA